jgi:DNA polymerase III delta prime subunit
MAHAYVVEGDREAGLSVVREHARTRLGLEGEHHPDVVILQYGLFSVDDARAVANFASSSPVQSDAKMVVVAATRIFHEAQNALLKLFEEPPAGVTMVLVVPSLGQLLPTLRSRVIALPKYGLTKSVLQRDATAKDFLALDSAGREKYIAKVLDRTKSDKNEEKQKARGELLRLVEDLLRVAYTLHATALEAEKKELTAFLSDLEVFLPILHERSAPLKLIFEHILLVLPRSLSK